MAVNITDILKPKYDTDTYALLEDIHLQGGFRVVSNTTEMNSITEQRKKEGMFVYNLEDKKLYTLKNSTFEIYEVSGINETSLFNLIKSEDPSVFEVKLDYNDKTILIPKIKKSENLEYTTIKSYDIPGLKDEFTEIVLDNLKISDMTTSGQEQPLTLNIRKDSYNNIIISGEVTGLQLGSTGLDTLPIENLKNRPSIVIGLNNSTKDWTQLIQYFNFITNSDAKNLSEDMVIRLYQDEIFINDESAKATFIPLMSNFNPQLIIVLDNASYLNQAINLKLNIRARTFYSFNKYLFIETTEKLYRLPYAIENGVGVLKGELDCTQAGMNQLVISTSNFEKHFNLNFDISTQVDWITTTNGTKVSVIENATSAALNTFYTMLEVTAEIPLIISDKLILNKSFDVNTDAFYTSSISNTKEALDVALSKIDELELGSYKPDLIISDDEILSTRERLNNGVAIAHVGTHNAKNIDLNDIGIRYSGSKFPEFKYSLQDEYVLKTASSTLPLEGSDLKLVKQNGKYRVVGELKNWAGIQNNMLIIPISYIEGVTEEAKFYDTVYFMQQFFNYPSQVITSDLNAVDNAKVLTSEEILIEGIESGLQLTFLTYPQLMMIIFKTDKSNFDITSANIKLSIEQAVEDYFDTTLPYMSSNFMSIGKLKFEDVNGEVHIKGTITNRLDKGNPANSIMVSSTGTIIENYFDNMQSPEVLNTITSASNSEYNYQISIDHSNKYGNMSMITLTGTNPIQNDEVITIDIPVKKNKNVSIEKAPENVEEALKSLKKDIEGNKVDSSGLYSQIKSSDETVINTEISFDNHLLIDPKHKKASDIPVDGTAINLGIIPQEVQDTFSEITLNQMIAGADLLSPQNQVQVTAKIVKENNLIKLKGSFTIDSTNLTPISIPDPDTTEKIWANGKYELDLGWAKTGGGNDYEFLNVLKYFNFLDTSSKYKLGGGFTDSIYDTEYAVKYNFPELYKSNIKLNGQYTQAKGILNNRNGALSYHLIIDGIQPNNQNTIEFEFDSDRINNPKEEIIGSIMDTTFFDFAPILKIVRADNGFKVQYSCQIVDDVSASSLAIHVLKSDIDPLFNTPVEDPDTLLGVEVYGNDELKIEDGYITIEEDSEDSNCYTFTVNTPSGMGSSGKLPETLKLDVGATKSLSDETKHPKTVQEYLDYLSKNSGNADNIIYNNPTPMPEKVGGYDAGTTFNNVNLVDLITGLLYPYQYPKFTTFTTTLKKQFKLGEGSGTSMEVTWDTSNKGNIKPNSIEIKVDGSDKLNTDTNNSGTETLTITEMKLTSQGTKQATAKLVNTKGTEATANITFSWVNTYYYGNSTEESLDEAKIKALTAVDANSLAKETTIEGNGYKYIAIPKAWGLKEFSDKDTGFGVSIQNPVSTVNITNDFAVAQDYYVFKTNQFINGSLTLVLK